MGVVWVTSLSFTASFLGSNKFPGDGGVCACGMGGVDLGGARV